jgi:hypothetical protein
VLKVKGFILDELDHVSSQINPSKSDAADKDDHIQEPSDIPATIPSGNSAHIWSVICLSQLSSDSETRSEPACLFFSTQDIKSLTQHTTELLH